MIPSPSPLGQLALDSPLCGPIARRFARRPSLREVAWSLIFEQSCLRGLKEQDPSALLLYRTDATGTRHVEDLADVLIECFCRGTPLSLDADTDYLSFYKGAETPFRSKLKVADLQALINETARYLLSTYQQALYEYWNFTRDGEGSPLRWLAGHLQQQYGEVLDGLFRSGGLDSLEAATARVIGSFPRAEARALLHNLVEVKVSLLGQATCAEQGLDPQLASAILLEREVPQLQRSMALVFSLSGVLYRFDSRKALRGALVNRCPGDAGPQVLHRYTTPGSVFVDQALLLREQQQDLISALARLPVLAGMSPGQSLQLRLDEAGSLLGVCQASQREMRQRFRLQLPDWLGKAGEEQRRDYAARLLRIAQRQRDGEDASFLDGVPDAFDFAREQLLGAMGKDHPHDPLPDLDDLELVNKQVTGVAIGSGGNVVPQGEERIVRLTPAQFALANLAVLRAGTVSLRSLAGATLPQWLTVDYLKALVTRLDVGGRYPAVLQRMLLDDGNERVPRQQRFIRQLREQLPLLALEMSMRDPATLSAESLARVDRLFRPALTFSEAVLRPLSFIAKAGATPDIAGNAWLIEAPQIGQGPCLLYRPLHREPLREYASRADFFKALCEAGTLQDDILQRLPAERQPVYARGGFAEPHVVRFFPGDEFSVISVPALAKLGEASVQGDVLEQLYLSCARELVERARQETLSTRESRWLDYQELGWLMLNTVLPFFNGPLVKAAWMLPLFSSLREVLSDTQGSAQPGALQQLLLSLALLLLPESESALPPESESPPGDGETVSIDAARIELPQVPKWSRFGWGSVALTAAQREALAGFRRVLTAEQLGTPMGAGGYHGLYGYQQQWWASIDGAVYQVSFTEDGPRLIDTAGKLGPWVRVDAEGTWQLDFGLRLRGGMPVNRRIAQLRESNRQRIVQLEENHTRLLGLRVASSERVQADLDEAARQQSPTSAHLQTYAGHLRDQDRLLVEFDDNLCQLHQLKPLPEFKRMHARNLYDRAGTQAQLSYVLHSWFSDNHAIMRDMRPASSPQEEQAPAQVEKFQRMMEACRKAKEQVDELIGCHQTIAGMSRLLREILPGGPELADKADQLLDSEPSLRSWKSADLSLRAATILDVEQSSDYKVLYSALLAARTGLSMRDAMEVKNTFSEAERVEILDSVVSRLAHALETTRLYQALPRKPGGKALLDAFIDILEGLQREAQDELAKRLQMLPQQSEPAAKPEKRKQVLIHTRNRGVVVGARRKAEGSRPETVVVVDPIDNSELARYEESSEPGVWQPVSEPRSEPVSPTPASLATLIKRSTPLLNNAERRIAKVRSQAKTATVGADIEDILTQEARPLDALVQQIQEALTRENATDDSVDGIDAARQCAALTAKAGVMREEGRRLRVDILKKQAPTVGHVSWLLDQHEVSIAREGERVALAKRKGLPQDYLQEFVVNDRDGKPLWYAHFHYPSADALVGDFSAAHLKTREQRYDRGPQAASSTSNQAIIEVYRSRIDKSSAQKLFLTL
ncbi:dermonecrotic toxin domain-containing protein [Pseudomonas wadenswilerensis]